MKVKAKKQNVGWRKVKALVCRTGTSMYDRWTWKEMNTCGCIKRWWVHKNVYVCMYGILCEWIYVIVKVWNVLKRVFIGCRKSRPWRVALQSPFVLWSDTSFPDASSRVQIGNKTSVSYGSFHCKLYWECIESVVSCFDVMQPEWVWH